MYNKNMHDYLNTDNSSYDSSHSVNSNFEYSNYDNSSSDDRVLQIFLSYCTSVEKKIIVYRSSLNKKRLKSNIYYKI